MKLKKTLTTLCLATLTITAYAETIHFLPVLKGRQYFECTVSQPNASVRFHTRNIDGEGMCPTGSVTVDGQTVNANYFVVKNAGGKPSMDVSVSDGTITCKNLVDADKDRAEFGLGSGFCLSR